MKTWLRILLGGVALIVVLVIIAFGIVRLTFDPGAYRAQIDSAVSRAVGRPVTVRGPIHILVLPWLGVRLRDVRVANARGFGDRPMARIGSATVSVRLLPLVFGEIRFGTLTLDDAVLRLTRRADGRSNWQPIVARLSRAVPINPRPRRATHQSHQLASALPVSSLRVGAVKINGARIRYDDDRDDRHYRLSDADLETGRISNGRPFRLEARGDLSWPDSNIVAAINVSSLIEPNVADRFYRFSGLNLHVLVSGSTVPGGRQEASAGASGDIDLDAGRFALDNVSLQSAGVTVIGDIDGTGLNDTLSYHGRITVGVFNPRSAMRQLGLPGPDTESGSAFTDAGFDAQFEGGARAVHFKQILATLDKSTLTGTVEIRDFAHPRYGFNLDLDALDVDAYLPSGRAAQAQSVAQSDEAAQTGGGAAQKAARFDLALLTQLRMHGRLSIGSLTFDGLNVENAIADLSAAGGALKIDSLKADLYGGSLSLRGSIDAAPKLPRYAVSGQINGVALSPLLADTVSGDRFEGTGSARIDLRARGWQVSQLERSLNGTAQLLVTGARIDGLDLGALLAAARHQAGNQDRSSGQTTTIFHRIDGHFTIDRGVARGDDLAWVSDRLSGRGKGRYSLPNNRLDYTLSVDVPRQADGELAPLAGRRVPIHLQGPLPAPNAAVNIHAAETSGHPPKGSPAPPDKPAAGDDHKTAQ